MECDLLAKASRPESEINVPRQGFILLRTAFDAAVFDLARLALRRKFFALVGTLGKQEKVSLSDLTLAGSFEAIRGDLLG
jgi:hypothetical protein